MSELAKIVEAIVEQQQAQAKQPEAVAKLPRGTVPAGGAGLALVLFLSGLGSLQLNGVNTTLNQMVVDVAAIKEAQSKSEEQLEAMRAELAEADNRVDSLQEIVEELEDAREKSQARFSVGADDADAQRIRAGRILDRFDQVIERCELVPRSPL